MSLQVWIPFDGDTRNKGASVLNFSPVSSNTTSNTSGKIGGCYYNNSFTAGGIVSDATIELGQKQSMFCWFKFVSLNSSSSLGGALVSQHRHATNSGMGITIKYASSTTGYLSVNTGNGSSRTFNTYCGTTLLQANTWYHGGFTYDGSTIRIYVNGVCEKEQAFTGMYVPADYITAFVWSFNTSSGTAVYSNYKLYGYLNDVRVYDHCLSTAEVKELAKGLVRHYKLEDFYSMNNLIVNGNGELGTENWLNSNMSTSEIPSGHSEIKASYYSGNRTVEPIKMVQNHSYTISCYVKAISGATGSSYPSIMPYDIDMNFIQNYHSQAGFNNSYKTTLAQPLKKGDTVIYATDLSAWTTATNNYYYHVAIFGYKNSLGEVYPDMVYTQDSPVFGTYSDKSHINKTNNTITLNSAFTGEDRPAGTTICQATEGSTYYYPWGGITVSSVSSWTAKSATFVPAEVTRLKAMAYMRWFAYNGLYYAGNKLVDNNIIDKSIVDCSGYGKLGTQSGNLSLSTNSARYDHSTVFDGSSAYIEADPLPTETATISVWVKTAWISSGAYKFIYHDKTTGICLGWTGSRLITYVGSAAGGAGSCIDLSTTNYAANKWNHIVVVKTGETTRNVYVNGVLASAAANNWFGGDMYKLHIGVRHVSSAYSAYLDGQISDFRAYVTQLSASDVQALYQIGARVAKNGTMLGYEMKEG